MNKDYKAIKAFAEQLIVIGNHIYNHPEEIFEGMDKVVLAGNTLSEELSESFREEQPEIN